MSLREKQPCCLNPSACFRSLNISGRLRLVPFPCLWPVLLCPSLPGPPSLPRPVLVSSVGKYQYRAYMHGPSSEPRRPSHPNPTQSLMQHRYLAVTPVAPERLCCVTPVTAPGRGVVTLRMDAGRRPTTLRFSRACSQSH